MKLRIATFLLLLLYVFALNSDTVEAREIPKNLAPTVSKLQTTAEIVQIVSGVIVAIAAMVTAIVATQGIYAWRKEFKGKRDIELAEETLELFYKAKDALVAIRSPLGYSNEGESVIERIKGKNDNVEINRQYAVILERYEAREEVFQRMQALRYRFMARFGKEKTEPFDEIRKCVNKIFISVRTVGELERQSRIVRLDKDKEEELRKRIRKYEADFWEGDDEFDELSPRIEKSVHKIEQICQEIIDK